MENVKIHMTEIVMSNQSYPIIQCDYCMFDIQSEIRILKK